MCIVITNYLTAMLTIGPCMDRVISHFPIEEKTCNLNQWTREVAILNTEVVLPYMVKSTESGQGISRYSYKHILPNHFFIHYFASRSVSRLNSCIPVVMI